MSEIDRPRLTPIDLLSRLPRPVTAAVTDIRIQGADQLRTEILRSRIMDSISSQVALAGIDPVAFEFGLVIKW